MTGLKFCKDCRWARCDGGDGPEALQLWVCEHASATIGPQPNLVTGRTKPPYQAECNWVRSTDANLSSGQKWCGRGGRYWEPKPSDVIGFGDLGDQDDA